MTNIPTISFINSLLRYSGNAAIVSYLVALFLIRPLLSNKYELLRHFYNFNLVQLRSIYNRLIVRFDQVPQMKVSYFGHDDYCDISTATETMEETMNRYYVDNLGFDIDNKTSTCEKSNAKAEEVLNRLELLNNSVKNNISSGFNEDLNIQLQEFNNLIEKNSLNKEEQFEQITSKIVAMKKQVL